MHGFFYVINRGGINVNAPLNNSIMIKMKMKARKRGEEGIGKVGMDWTNNKESKIENGHGKMVCYFRFEFQTENILTENM